MGFWLVVVMCTVATYVDTYYSGVSIHNNTRLTRKIENENIVFSYMVLSVVLVNGLNV